MKLEIMHYHIVDFFFDMLKYLQCSFTMENKDLEGQTPIIDTPNSEIVWANNNVMC